MTTAITANMLDAIKVQFLKPIFEDDFPERGMTAWLTAVEWEAKNECYKLYFDFTEFEAINAKYFQESYYSNRITEASGVTKQFYTALDSGNYTPKYSVYYNCGDFTNRDDVAFAESIKTELKVVD